MTVGKDDYNPNAGSYSTTPLTSVNPPGTNSIAMQHSSGASKGNRIPKRLAGS